MLGFWTSFVASVVIQGWGLPETINSLAPGRFQRNFRKVMFQLILVIDGWSISCKIVLKWMPMDLTDGKSTLVQVMAWCRQATSHYLSQCWLRSLSPYGVIRPQWVLIKWKIELLTKVCHVLVITCIMICEMKLLWFIISQTSTVELWEWVSNFVPHHTGPVITYPWLY